MLHKRLIQGNTVKQLLERDGRVDIEGEVSLGNLNHLAAVMGVNEHVLYVSTGPGETTTISIPKDSKS